MFKIFIYSSHMNLLQAAHCGQFNIEDPVAAAEVIRHHKESGRHLKVIRPTGAISFYHPSKQVELWIA